MADASPAHRHFIHVAAALGTRDEKLIGERLEQAAAVIDPVGVDELLLMSFFVTGFPAGLAALRLWKARRPPGPRSRDSEGPDDLAARGAATCQAVYGSQFQPLSERLAGLHPDLPHFVIDIGYGAMMGRPGLPLGVRELCMVAMLVPWNAPVQLYSHIRGALLNGVAPGQVEDAVKAGIAAAALTSSDSLIAENATDTLERVLASNPGG